MEKERLLIVIHIRRNAITPGRVRADLITIHIFDPGWFQGCRVKGKRGREKQDKREAMEVLGFG